MPFSRATVVETQLDPQEFERYSRQIIRPEIGSAGQQRLRDARVLVVGAGGLGSPVLTYLAACGVGTLGIVDPDRVTLSNLHRQTLFDSSQIGELKVEASARRLTALNPHITIERHPVAFAAHNASDLISAYDVVVDGCDNFSTRYLVNDACVTLDKPLVSASLSDYAGQLSVFNIALPGGGRAPTYRCLYPEPPPPEQAPACAEAGVLGVVPGVLGSLQAVETLKVILMAGDVLAGRVLLIDLLTMQFRTVQFTRDEQIVATTTIRSDQYYRELHQCRSVFLCKTSGPSEIAAETLARDLAESEQPRFLLVDVREEGERAQDHIGGVHIPLRSLPHSLAQLPPDLPLVFYCKSGIRSMDACRFVHSQRSDQELYSLSGGLTEYRRKGF